MIRKFIGNSFLYAIATILSKAILLLTLPLLASYYNPEVIGIIDTVTIISAILPPLLSLEVYQGFARLFPEMTNLESRIKLLSTSLLFTFYSNFFLLIFFFLFKAELISYLGIRDPNFFIFTIVSLLIIITFLFSSIIEHLRWMQMARNYAIVNIAYVSLFTIMIFTGFFLFDPTIDIYFISQLISFLFAIFLSLFFMRKYLRWEIDMNYLKRLFSFSLPLVISTFAFNSAQYIDRVTVKDVFGNESLGIIGLIIRISAFINVIIIIFQGPLMPLIYSQYSESKSNFKIQLILKIFLFVFSSIVCLISVLANEIVGLFASKEYAYASVTLPFFCLKSFFSQAYSFAPGLSIAKKTKIISFLFLGYLVLNIITIPLYSKFDNLLILSIGSAVNAILFFLVYFYLSSLHYKIDISYLRLISLIFFLFVFILIINPFIVNNIKSNVTYLFKIGSFIVQVFICFVICLNKNEITHLRKGATLIKFR